MGRGKNIAINFVIAHAFEAKPFIDYYKLSKNIGHNGFNIFENAGIRLIISGQGKINAAAATAYLGAMQAQKGNLSFWVNAGIAGHPCERLGSLWRVNKITDDFSGRSIYPVLLPGRSHCSQRISGTALMTVDSPTSSYPYQCLYDMEAFGFYQNALRFAALESVFSFKVVSDNLKNPSMGIEKKAQAELLTPHIENLNQYLHNLYPIININKPIETIGINQFKLTHSQNKIVKTLLESLHIHGLDCKPILSQCTDARQLIVSLEQKLKSIELVV